MSSELKSLRLNAFLRDTPEAAMAWANSAANAHFFVHYLRTAGWTEEEQLGALQSLCRNIFSQAAEISENTK